LIRNQLDVTLRKFEQAIREPKEGGSRNPDVSLPVDLSIISEEKPTNWQEGMEMTGEQATRTFLKIFRSNEVFGNGITAFMDKTFNKRPAELH
jgi:hypothetical protein